MYHALRQYGLALLLAVPASGWAGESWLDAEIRAQEARWTAQRGRMAPLRPVRAAARPAPTPRHSQATRRTASREHPLAFPPLATRTPPSPPVDAREIAPVRPRHARPIAANGIVRAILTSAHRHRLDPLLVKAVILAESGGRRKARSPKGALGLMQLMPQTARRFGVTDPYDPAQNVEAGAVYLRWLLDRYGDVSLALAGYNAGEGKVDRYGGMPPYRETLNYVIKVRSTHHLLSRVVADKLARTTW